MDLTTLTIGTPEGNRDADLVVIGTPQGNRDVIAAWIGTTSGNQLFVFPPPEDPPGGDPE